MLRINSDTLRDTPMAHNDILTTAAATLARRRNRSEKAFVLSADRFAAELRVYSHELARL